MIGGTVCIKVQYSKESVQMGCKTQK